MVLWASCDPKNLGHLYKSLEWRSTLRRVPSCPPSYCGIGGNPLLGMIRLPVEDLRANGIVGAELSEEILLSRAEGLHETFVLLGYEVIHLLQEEALHETFGAELSEAMFLSREEVTFVLLGDGRAFRHSLLVIDML